MQIEITSNKFEGKSLVAQHRLVNDVLKTKLDLFNDIHGLTLKTNVN